MSLLADIQAAKKVPGIACAVRTLRADLTDDLRADLDVALADLTLPGAAIARALTNRGHRIGQQSITRHRNGECSCGRAA